MEDAEMEQREEEREIENIARAYKYLQLGLILELFAVIIFFFILAIYIGWFSFYLLLVFVAFWIKKSIYIVEGDEMAVKLIVGTAVEVVGSGLQFVPWFLGCGLVLYPTKTYNLDYPKRSLYTKKGVWPEKGKDKTEYGKEAIELDSTAYISFPRDERLIKVYKNHIPVSPSGLKDWTEEAVVSSLRTAFGNKTWGEATEKFEKTRKEADDNFRRSDGPMIKAGFKENGIQLAVEEIFLPKEVEKSLADVDVSRLKKEASNYFSKETAEKRIGTLMEMVSKETGMSRKQIEKKIKEDSAQFVEDNKEIWEKNWDLIYRVLSAETGSFVHIKVDGAESGSLEKMLLELFGAWQRMPRGGKNPRINRSSDENRSSDKGRSWTDEEIDREIERYT
jgi:hypothetical protein